ncbi:MAG TPA: hypothetical protein VMU04_15835 [Candidatus Acidoferrum sp.]|nr:hypothetical protein [Candidatus Acidoferrum sp.]
MKTKALTLVCAATMGVATATPALADCTPDPTVVVADAVVMRPALFVTTVAGSALFVAVLPIAAVSRSIKSTAHALVVAPAKATFTRPLGDFDYAPSRCCESEVACCSK